MPYVLYGGKMITVGDKYVTGLVAAYNRLTDWENIDFDTFTSSGKNITSAIETAATYGRCWSNDYPVIGGWPTYGTVYFRFYLTLNSGSAPYVQFYKNNVVTGTHGFSYSGPGEYEVGEMVIGSANSGNYRVGFISGIPGSGAWATNFSATDCRMFISDGDGNPFSI